MTYIKELAQFEGQEVELKGWNAQARDSKGLVFMTLRDGTGFVQCIINTEVVGADSFEAAKKLRQESALSLIGTVVKDDRQFGGYEVQVKSLQVISEAEEQYPISPKEHGVDFLMDNRHLWLRSKRQWAIMRVRNEIIYSNGCANIYR